MRVNGNNLIVQRGEEFTVDFNLLNKDGAPYVVNIDLVKPHILVSVVSNSYNTSNAYMLNQWCDVSNYFRFISVNPAHLTSLVFDMVEYPNTATIVVGENEITYCSDCIFEYNGKYYYYDYDDGFVLYDFRIILTFTSAMTREWSSQQYNYSISLVSGAKLIDMDQSTSSFEDKIEMRVPILANATISVLNVVGG